MEGPSNGGVQPFWCYSPHFVLRWWMVLQGLLVPEDRHGKKHDEIIELITLWGKKSYRRHSGAAIRTWISLISYWRGWYPGDYSKVLRSIDQRQKQRRKLCGSATAVCWSRWRTSGGHFCPCPFCTGLHCLLGVMRASSQGILVMVRARLFFKRSMRVRLLETLPRRGPRSCSPMTSSRSMLRTFFILQQGKHRG